MILSNLPQIGEGLGGQVQVEKGLYESPEDEKLEKEIFKNESKVFMENSST